MSIYTLSAQQDFDGSVRKAVERQMKVYPKSTLKDIYKNFFQDEFGPGHIVSDTTAAGNYLRREMDSYTEITGEVAEPLGWRNNFCRVNLSVVKDGWVPYSVFFDAFVESVNSIQPMSVAEWEEECNKIEGIIHSMNLNLPNYKEDKEEISERLAKGEYVGHHSSIYEEAYTPHYRIMSSELFEMRIKSYLF